VRAAAALIPLVAGCDYVLHLDDIHPLAAPASYRKAITITQATGATLADVPVSVTLANDPGLAAHARSDGSDILFDDGTSELATEVVAYDAGTLDAWVRLPMLPSGTTTIYLGYGGATRTSAPTAAWPPAFVGVWHLAEADSSTRDSTSHGHSLAAVNTAPPTVAGIAGAARSFGPLSQEMCATDLDGSLDPALGSFSYSVWVFAELSLGQFDSPLYHGGGSPGDPGYDLELGLGPWDASLSDGTVTQQLQLMSEVVRQWTHLVVVVDRGQTLGITFRDGSPVDSVGLSVPGALSGSAPICIGGAGGNDPFHGAIDEVRVLLGAESPAQIAFEYANLARRDQVIAVGAEEALRP
jgi:hypothetical protein